MTACHDTMSTVWKKLFLTSSKCMIINEHMHYKWNSLHIAKFIT